MRDRELHSGGEEEVRDREEEKSREEVDRGGEDEGRDRGGQEEVSESEEEESKEEESKEEESEGDGSGEHTSGTSGQQDLKWIIYKKTIRTMYSTTIIATSTHYISRLLAGPK